MWRRVVKEMGGEMWMRVLMDKDERLERVGGGG